MKYFLPPVASLVGRLNRLWKIDRRDAAQYPARQGRIVTEATADAKIVRIIDLDKGGRLQIVGIDDTAILLIMLFMQQLIDLREKVIKFIN